MFPAQGCLCAKETSFCLWHLQLKGSQKVNGGMKNLRMRFSKALIEALIAGLGGPLVWLCVRQLSAGWRHCWISCFLLGCKLCQIQHLNPMCVLVKWEFIVAISLWNSFHETPVEAGKENGGGERETLFRGEPGHIGQQNTPRTKIFPLIHFYHWEMDWGGALGDGPWRLDRGTLQMSLVWPFNGDIQ